MPHERGSLPVLPSEFACPVLADPKTRFNRSLATRPSSISPWPDPRQLIDPKALNYRCVSVSEGLALPLPTDACVPIHDPTIRPEMRRPALFPFPPKNWNEPKRRATNIVTRPGRTCKPTSGLLGFAI